MEKLKKEQALLLENADLILENGSVQRGRSVLISKGIIARIGAAGEQIPLQEPARVMDCTGLFVSCSFANLHAHTAMNIFKGIAEDVTADQWFNEMIFPYESQMTSEDVYLGTKLGIAEMLANGVTVVADHYFGEEEVLRAAMETGIRMDLAPTLFGMAPDIRERMAQVKEFILAHRGTSDRIAFHIGPHANYTCPPDVLGEMADLAKGLNLPIHTHIAEEQVQVQRSLEQYGLSPFAYMDRAGVFAVPVLFAHGLWIGEEDLQYLTDDTMFGFCPKTYMKLGSGQGGFFRLYDRLNFSFGTDGAASSNTVSPLEQARLFALLVKFIGKDGRLADASRIWKQLMLGHRAFPFGTGYLREGAPADLLIWDLDTPQTSAWYHPVSAILYSAQSSNIRYTLAGGRFLKYDGQLVMDDAALRAEAQGAQRRLLARGKGKAEVTYLK